MTENIVQLSNAGLTPTASMESTCARRTVGFGGTDFSACHRPPHEGERTIDRNARRPIFLAVYRLNGLFMHMMTVGSALLSPIDQSRRAAAVPRNGSRT